MEEKKSIKKRKRKRIMWLVLSFVSLMCFIILMAEFVCGLWLHHNYKTQSIYGKNTYIAYDDDRDVFFKYSEFKKMGIENSIDDLYFVKTTDDGGGKEYYKYNTSDGFEPDDDEQVVIPWERFFDDVFFKKYKDYMWFYVTAYVDVSEKTDRSQVIRNSYIYGPKTLMNKGEICTGSNECIVSEGYSIGDKIELMDKTEHVVGVIKSENLLIPNEYGIIGALYMHDGYNKYLKSYFKVIRSYEEFLVCRDNGSALSSYHINKVIFDRSVVSPDDMEYLKAISLVKSLKDAYGRYATAYVYIFAIFPILFLGLLIFSIRRLIKSFR